MAKGSKSVVLMSFNRDMFVLKCLSVCILETLFIIGAEVELPCLKNIKHLTPLPTFMSYALTKPKMPLGMHKG